MIEIICTGCNNKFEKSLKNYKQNIKRNGKNICQGCKDRIKKERMETTNFSRLYTETVSSAKKKNFENNICKEYLEQLYIIQKGRCAISGVPLKPFVVGIKNEPDTVSVDRIDSDKGYIMGNIQLVCHSWNLGKLRYTQEQMKFLLIKVKHQLEEDRV